MNENSSFILTRFRRSNVDLLVSGGVALIYRILHSTLNDNFQWPVYESFVVQDILTSPSGHVRSLALKFLTTFPKGILCGDGYFTFYENYYYYYYYYYYVEIICFPSLMNFSILFIFIHIPRSLMLLILSTYFNW
jgi:hypothetical protein